MKLHRGPWWPRIVAGERQPRSRAWQTMLAGVCLTLYACVADAHPEERTAELPATVREALRQAGIPERALAVVVMPVEEGRPLLSHNGRQAMNPASSMKLVTTYAGLELLGPAYTWRTEVLADALPINGRLDGHLYLRGSGDPKLTVEYFWRMLRQLYVRGVSDIRGDLILDHSAFALLPHDSAEFDNEPLRPYNAGPDALLINLKSVQFTLQPDVQGKAVKIFIDTPSDGLNVVNRLQLGRESCGDWREQIHPAVRGLTVELTGAYPASCGEKILSLSPWPADLQVETLFRALWRELGGTFSGQVRHGHTPASASILFTHDSPPLGELVRDLNKHSNNVMARQLFLSLDSARPATPEGARQRILSWLQDKGLRMPELVLDNGSGLSRQERIAAESFAQLLRAAWRSPVMPELLSSLPIAGVDGTLRNRLAAGPATGRAHLKTGYLDGVRALAGYVLDRSGKRWIVVCLLNDPHARLGKPAIDALLSWVAKR